jgi:hypothetical protein
MVVVAFAVFVYQGMLKRASRLIPAGVSVCFLADRGESRYSTDALSARACCTGNERIRVKSNTWIYRPKKGWKQLNSYHLAAGESVVLQGITLTKTQPLERLNLALGRDPLSGQLWLVATDEPA